MELTNPVRLIRCSEGCIDYDTAWRWQIAVSEDVRSGAPEAIALLEHAPVFTFGRRARYDHLLIQPVDVQGLGATIVESDRGGDVTFHGPGQLVAYPILDLRRRGLGPSAYVRRLEEAIIQALLGFGVQGARSSGRPGVWVHGAKIAAIGVRVHGGVSTHGLALNVETDLACFGAIVPCGINDAGVTSLARLTGQSHGMTTVMDTFCGAFATVFGSDLVPCFDFLGSRDAVIPRNVSKRCGSNRERLDETDA